MPKWSALAAITPATVETTDLVAVSDLSAGLSKKLTVAQNLQLGGELAKCTPVTYSDYTWVNQGSSTGSSSTGTLAMVQPGTITSSVAMLVKNVPTAPYTFTARIRHHFLSYANANGGQGTGLCLYDSGTGKFANFGFNVSPDWATYLLAGKYTNVTTYTADYNLQKIVTPMEWLRIRDDNTTRYLDFSADGANWTVFHSVGRTDFLTPDKIGFYMDIANTNAVSATMTVLSAAAT